MAFDCLQLFYPVNMGMTISDVLIFTSDDEPLLTSNRTGIIRGFKVQRKYSYLYAVIDVDATLDNMMSFLYDNSLADVPHDATLLLTSVSRRRNGSRVARRCSHDMLQRLPGEAR